MAGKGRGRARGVIAAESPAPDQRAGPGNNDGHGEGLIAAGPSRQRVRTLQSPGAGNTNGGYRPRGQRPPAAVVERQRRREAMADIIPKAQCSSSAAVVTVTTVAPTIEPTPPMEEPMEEQPADGNNAPAPANVTSSSSVALNLNVDGGEDGPGQCMEPGCEGRLVTALLPFPKFIRQFRRLKDLESVAKYSLDEVRPEVAAAFQKSIDFLRENEWAQSQIMTFPNMTSLETQKLVRFTERELKPLVHAAGVRRMKHEWECYLILYKKPRCPGGGVPAGGAGTGTGAAGIDGGGQQ